MERENGYDPTGCFELLTALMYRAVTHIPNTKDDELHFLQGLEKLKKSKLLSLYCDVGNISKDRLEKAIDNNIINVKKHYPRLSSRRVYKNVNYKRFFK